MTSSSSQPAAMPAAPVPPARPPTKAEHLHGLLRAAILTNELPPGAYLNIDELARRHGVSPIPVREAVARLATERLAVIRPHVGAEVAALGEDSVHDVFALLEGLETASAARVAARAQPNDLRDLESLLAELDRAAASRATGDWARANTAFHLRLASIAGLPLVQDELRIAFDHWDRIRRHFYKDAAGPRLAQAQREHRQLVAAVRAGAAGTLERLLRRHNRTARATYLPSGAKRQG